MNSILHDAALRRKTGGLKILKKMNFKGNRYSKCVNSAAQSNDASITTSMLKWTSAKKITIKNNVYSNSAANMESDNEELFLNNNFLWSTTSLIDRDILKSIINLFGTCPNCSNKSIDIIYDHSQKKRLSFLLNFVCHSEICYWSQSF